jgi:hypothetical protein
MFPEGPVPFSFCLGSEAADYRQKNGSGDNNPKSDDCVFLPPRSQRPSIGPIHVRKNCQADNHQSNLNED